MSGYAHGVFPMAEARESPDLHWVEPRERGIFPLEAFHISRSLRRTILKGDYEIAINQDFLGTVLCCAERPETWINDELLGLYGALHARGCAHSMEVRVNGRLAGGVFGLTLGRAFFGESMFSRATDMSKLALAYLVDRLRRAGFELFDTQFLTPHLASLGAVGIPQRKYLVLLKRALEGQADFARPITPQPSDLMQFKTQTS